MCSSMLFSASSYKGYTASLTVDYRKPVPLPAVLCLHSEVENTDGRKIWLKGALSDRPGGTTYAESTALFITPKAE